MALTAVTACTGGGSATQSSSRTKSTAPPPAAPGGGPFRAFAADSWWNTPVPADAPSDPRAAQILDYMSTGPDADGGCVRLSGAENSPWGQPVYWARSSDPTYDVAVKRNNAPSEVHSLRIPRGAKAAQNNDGSMTVFDVERGYVVALTDAAYDARGDKWSASGATVTYLHSNGLDVRTGESSDPRNKGTHRGNNAAVMMARYDEVKAGQIDHVLKIASGPETSARHVFPMTGSDGSSTDPDAPPQGLRFRIKPSVNLGRLGLDQQTLVIAEAMQKYGIYIGDSSGATALKLEDTRLEGRGELWSMPQTALCKLPLTSQYWDVLPEGYIPPQPG